MAIAARASPAPRRRRPRLVLTTPTLLGLPLAWLAVFFLVPIAIVAAYSFDVYSLDPGPHGFTLTAWHSFLHSSVWLPFVALPIFVSLESLDRRLLEAASDLGASRLQAFRRITLPLSLPGVIAAFLFVFIPTLGEFVTPSLVGGTSGYMYGNQIVDLFGTGFPDWQTGSVLAIFLLGVVAALTVVFSRFLQPRQVTAD